MSGTKLTGIGACVFDAYGTLFDFNSAAEDVRDLLGAKFDRLNTMWREKQIQYTWLRAAQARHANFWQVTGDALDFTMETLEIADPALRQTLMALYLHLKPFPEVKDTLKKLKAAGFKTAILSNGSLEMLTALVESSDTAALLDGVYSVEEVGVFKPHPKVYALAGEHLGLKADAIAFQSANAWDAYAASAFGMRVVWCNRSGQRPEHLPGTPDAMIKTLAELPGLIAP
jgi:2-haloacid dehalogenase